MYKMVLFPIAALASLVSAAIAQTPGQDQICIGRP